MNRPPHGADVAIAGAITIDPPLDGDQIDRLELIALVTSHESLRDGITQMVDEMLPGRPDGPSGWATCDNGCCLEVVSPHLKPESVGPWLGYLIERIESASPRPKRRYDGSIVVWSAADRSFDALWVDGRQVRRGRLQRPEARDRPGAAQIVSLKRRGA